MSTLRVEPLDEVRRVPVVTAHPDDVDLDVEPSALRAHHSRNTGFTADEVTPRQRPRADAERREFGTDRLAETFQIVDTA